MQCKVRAFRQTSMGDSCSRQTAGYVLFKQQQLSAASCSVYFKQYFFAFVQFYCVCVMHGSHSINTSDTLSAMLTQATTFCLASFLYPPHYTTITESPLYHQILMVHGVKLCQHST